MLKLTTLASGSDGNCALLEIGKTKLLIDAGISARQIKRKLEMRGVDMGYVSGILVTHEHADHTCGLEVFRKLYDLIPIIGTKETTKNYSDICITPGVEFSFIKDLRITPFSVPHDAIDPVGYVIQNGEHCMGILTDLGIVTPSILRRLEPCTDLMIESNYDEALLASCDRPQTVKDRTASRHGHLSNKQAAGAILALCGHNLKRVTLCHLSKVCNTPELAMKATQDAQDERMQGVKITIADPV